MRPGMTDQLAGIRRILDEIIAPELRDGYPSQVLRGVVKNLAMLEGAWTRIAEFLEWDTAATASLLQEAKPYVDGELWHRITEVLDVAAHGSSSEDMERHDDELRELLVEAIRQLAERPEAAGVWQRIKEHLVERTHQYPFRMAIAAPTQAKR